MVWRSVLAMIGLVVFTFGIPSVHAQSSKKASSSVAQRANPLEAKISAATAAFKEQRFEEAARLFQEVVTQDPGHALAWHFLGQSLDKSGKKQEARSAYEKSLELQPTGSVADRNRTMLSQLRTRPEPKLPPELSPETRNIILKTPLFISSPDTVATKCVETRISEIMNIRHTTETTKTTMYSPRPGGMVEVTIESKNVNSDDAEPSFDRWVGLSLLGGKVILASSYWSGRGALRNDPPSISISEVLSATGTFFPLRIGNRFTTKSSSKKSDNKITGSYEATCEVVDVVNSALALQLIGVEDAHRLRCEVMSNNLFGLEKPTTSIGQSICSNTLGLCLLSWLEEDQTSDNVPDFAGGYTYTRRNNFKYSIRKTCSPAK